MVRKVVTSTNAKVALTCAVTDTFRIPTGVSIRLTCAFAARANVANPDARSIPLLTCGYVGAVKKSANSA